VIENTLYICTSTRNGKRNSKMSCFLTKHIHFAQTLVFQTTFQKFIHSGFACICNMNKFIRYITLSNSSKICCMAKGAPSHLLQRIHVLFDRMYNPWIERNGCALLCGMKTVLQLQYVYTHQLVSLVKKDHYFFTATLASTAIAYFFICCSIS
jgi:hypothetical protein